MVNSESAPFFCRIIEPIVQKYGAHIALTGGCLFKEGYRKDIDIVIYRHRQVEKIDFNGLFQELKRMGIVIVEDFGFCKKFKWEFFGNDVRIDMLYPEYPDEGNYENND